ncbi:MAG: hypothetical protein ACRDJN_02035 [Chloroflexota bacterium]
MASRELAFSDPEVIRLASDRFIPLAENCSPLQTQRDAKGEFFRLVAEQGHYAGRTVPSATRQGQYAFTAGGILLGSINTREVGKMLGMLQQALRRWAEIRDGGAAAAGDAPASYQPDPRYPPRYPVDGLVLKVFLRDLARHDDGREPDWRSRAVNYDYAWFTKEEARSLVPSTPRAGTRQDVPWPIARRLARFHLLDAVRGETPSWREDEVRSARLWTEVVAVDGPRVELRLGGTVLNAATGTWAVRPFREKVAGRTRGYHCRLRGNLTYDRSREAFTRFDVLAVGDRWGGTEHNVRWDDLAPAPLGIAFELAGTAPRDRTPPHANLWDYFGVPVEQRPR